MITTSLYMSLCGDIVLVHKHNYIYWRVTDQFTEWLTHAPYEGSVCRVISYCSTKCDALSTYVDGYSSPHDMWPVFTVLGDLLIYMIEMSDY